MSERAMLLISRKALAIPCYTNKAGPIIPNTKVLEHQAGGIGPRPSDGYACFADRIGHLRAQQPARILSGLAHEPILKAVLAGPAYPLRHLRQGFLQADAHSQLIAEALTETGACARPPIGACRTQVCGCRGR